MLIQSESRASASIAGTVHCWHLQQLARISQHRPRCTRQASSSLFRSLAVRASVTDPAQDLGPVLVDGLPAVESAAPYITHTWNWENHNINYAVAGQGKPVVLVHGFGASVGHWRKNVPRLAQDYKVYAIDLLGFGHSDKPLLTYSTEAWRRQLLSFLQTVVQEPAVLVGNSLGSLICLMACAEYSDSVKGMIMFNCAGGMNNKCTPEDWRVKLAMPFFLLIDFLLKRPRVARYLFDKFRSPENLRKVLTRVYVSPEAVDDALVDLLYTPSSADGALEAFVSMITEPPGPRPEEFIHIVSCPLLFLWGDKDPFTPLDGPVGRYFKTLPQLHDNIAFEILPDTGHCPHDDRPEVANERMLVFLQQHHT